MKMIIDVRYFPTEKYVFDKPLNFIGVRYARKLRELYFLTDFFDHININLNETKVHGDIQISNQIERFININVGVSPVEFNKLTLEEKQLKIIDLTANVLFVLCERYELDNEKINFVKNMLLKYKTELEILHLVKETSKYKVAISYQIRPLEKKSISFVEYTDKKNKQTCKKILCELKHYEDILFLVASISVKGNEITLKPRQSSTAEQFISSYDTPIKIYFSELLI